MAVATKVPPALKWHGGKAPLASCIVELMPPRCKNPNRAAADDAGWLHYVEPYFGGGSVLFANDPEGISEVANDLNQSLTNFWLTLKDELAFPVFRQQIEATPFSELEYRAACESGEPILSVADPYAAVAFFIRCRQSLAGRMKGFTGVTKTRTRRGMNNEVSAWLTCIEGLPAVHERLKRVLILNRPALEVIAKHDGPQTLFYLDPPYLHETRATTGEYVHEMTAEQHRELLELLATLKGKFMLSGYPSELYDEFAKRHGWRVVDFEMPNNSSGAITKRRMTERLWLNY